MKRRKKVTQMIIINRKEKIEQYNVKKAPNFNHKKSIIAWYHRQQRNAQLINIKVLIFK